MVMIFVCCLVGGCCIFVGDFMVLDEVYECISWMSCYFVGVVCFVVVDFFGREFLDDIDLGFVIGCKDIRD